MARREFRRVRSPRTNTPDQRIPLAVPSGATPQALRVIRNGQPTVVLPLEAGREYELGRSEKADIYFPDPSVSRRHGVLNFSEAACAWVFKDLNASNGSFVRLDENQQRVLDASPVGLVAGHELQLGEPASRIEFLAEVPLEAATALAETDTWKSDAARKLQQRVTKREPPRATGGPTGAFGRRQDVHPTRNPSVEPVREGSVRRG